MPPRRSSGKGRGSASMRETPLMTTFQTRMTAFGRLMHSFPADPANSHYTTRIHPALTSFADEVCGTLARLIRLCDDAGSARHPAASRSGSSCPMPRRSSRRPKAAWSLAERSARAFAVGQLDLHDKTETYEIFRHPEGGRKDVFHWTGADEKPVAELEIYRPGGEFNQPGPRSRPNSPPGWTRAACASWKPPASSTASSAPSTLLRPDRRH